ncbi:hypothetical protein GQ55_6G052700 [Panicum hallii var. hallii]|uniref:DOG1 domain-containing protein n=4 Tax=Panicum hallii TaxID=206008 RepID=A0A2T7D437_9POAL|nr:transcription factor TGA2.3-like isoform X1 [Panicum hallii]PAN33882.1 hypothetical protein PAHAL_6G054400 [Panicum hallii]PUZ50354.1 hypothetical protein GQ55_6G052700 [Panicum hallii var. hallii]
MELYPGYLEDHFNIHKLSRLQPLAASGAHPGRYANATPAAAAAGAGAMGIYGRQRHQMAAAGVWGDPFRPDGDALAAVAAPVTAVAAPVDVDVETEVKFGNHLAQDDVVPVEDAPPSSDSFGHDDARPRDKVQRRLAQNREAARKSRLRKKAYIQNLETSRMKLAQLEQELTMARRQQGAHAAGGLLAPPVDPRVAAFEMEYARWVEDQKKQARELRAALQSGAPEFQLRFLVDAALAHYGALFEAKSRAARADAFFVLSGVWRAPAERFFLWIGGFRPSELLKVLAPQLDPLAEPQASAVRMLQNTARQLEDALSQGMNKLQQTLVDALMTVDAPDDAASGAGGGYAARQMASAVGKLDDLVSFVDQADHLRQQTLRNMNKILTVPQAARGLLALADYSQRLRALSSLWAARPREPA